MARFLRHLNVFVTTALVIVLSSFSYCVCAEPLNNLIAPQIGIIRMNETRISSANTSSQVTDLRYTLRVDFMNIESHLSVNLSAATGGGYSDYGLQARIFDTAKLIDDSATLIFYGLGGGFSYSPGFHVEGVTKAQPFVDTLFSAFARIQWDTGSQWGIFTEFSYEGIIKRAVNGDGATKAGIRGISNRYAMIVGIPFEVDL
ncbi:MAG: hypothetical protein ABIR96_07525 [Bdellovibrionota bacterium]